MLRFEDIQFDCSLYNGYKPCRHGNDCAGCPFYDPLQLPDGKMFSPAQFEDVIPAPGLSSILIIKTGAMGDVLRTTTLLAPLARAYPHARVTWVTDKSALPLLAGAPGIHELKSFDLQSTTEAESRSFDLLLNYEKEREPLALAGRVKATWKMGFAPTPWETATVFNAQAREGLVLGLSDEMKFHLNTKSYPQIACEMAGLPYRRDPYVLTMKEESLRRKNQIEEALVGRPGLVVGLNTGCGEVFKTKQWTKQGWMELVQFLNEHSHVKLLLLGGKAESELNRNILASTQNVVDTGTDNSLSQFFGVIDACDVIVTSDSLGMHIAIALGKRVVALFGSTSHTEIDLFDKGEKIITDFPCAPCYRKTCDMQLTCMQALRGETVGAAVLRQLGIVERVSAAT